MEPFRSARELIVTIPGISTGVADVIIAETGADMSRFPTAGHLASWAGTCPGSNESAGREKSTHDASRQPLSEGCARRCRDVGCPQQAHLPRREFPTNRVAQRPHEGDRRS